VTAEASLAAASLAAAAALALLTLRTRRRLVAVEDRARRLEDLVRTELEPALEAARRDAQTAAATARDAAVAAGTGSPPPRLPLEPVTGPVVRAVAFGASARRAIARVTAPPWSRRRGLARSA
jgi:hypothetical protein